jgi:hypothetical protein
MAHQRCKSSIGCTFVHERFEPACGTMQVHTAQGCGARKGTELGGCNC